MTHTERIIHNIMCKRDASWDLTPETDIEGYKLDIGIPSHIHFNKVETEEEIRKKVRWLLLEIAELAILEARQI